MGDFMAGSAWEIMLSRQWQPMTEMAGYKNLLRNTKWNQVEARVLPKLNFALLSP